MRLLIGVVLFAGFAAAGDVARLEELANTRQLFLLREALQQPGWTQAETLFYRGMVDSRFGRERAGIDALSRFVATRPPPERRRRAYDELASALAREGRYGEAARNVAEALRVTPAGERTELENKRKLYAALADVPPQSVSFGQNVPVRATFNVLGSWDVPVDVRGRQGAWIFDTGANMSTLSAGEARRLGLETRESDAYVSGSTGRTNPLRLAVASELRLGRARLKNVVFLVLSDEALFVGPLKHQIRGILGLPVIRALGRVGIAASGHVGIEPGRTGTPNLFFDGLTPIVDVRHAGSRRQMMLDTGANASFFSPSFRSALTKNEIAGLTATDEKIGGAGGVVVRRTEVVRTLRIFIGERPVDLANVSLLTAPPEGDARYRSGVLGTDALRGGFTIDFRAMQLQLE